MFLEDINLVDVTLEGLKVIGMIFLIFTLLREGKRYPSLSGSRWNIIVNGFILMLIGFAFDWSDEFLNYEASLVLETLEDFIEEIGLISGLFLVTVGFDRWFKFISHFLDIEAKTYVKKY